MPVVAGPGYSRVALPALNAFVLAAPIVSARSLAVLSSRYSLDWLLSVVAVLDAG